jgi:hypothetical protein
MEKKEKKAFRGFLLNKEPLLIGLSSGLLISTIAMLFISIAAEGFLVVKINEIYWFFVSIMIAALNYKIDENKLKKWDNYRKIFLTFLGI